MNEEAQQLERECDTLTRYLVGTRPTSYVCRKYVEAHAHLSPEADRFDELLIRVARRAALGAKLADSYARVFAPGTLLRKKLVVLLAILETCSPSFRLIDEIDSDKRFVLLLRISMRAAGFGVALVAATAFLLPAQLALGRSARRARP